MSRQRFLQFSRVVISHAMVGVLVLLVACQTASHQITISPSGDQDSLPTVTIPKLTEPPSNSILPTSTAVVIPVKVESTQAGEIPPTAAPDPLRFDFPDSAPAPVSAWRPPLYPVPWAPTPYDHFYFSRPIAADEVNWPLANYRYGGVFFEDVVHTGVDIPAPSGTPVVAAGDGKVIWAGYGLYRGVAGDLSDPYGQAVVIRHDFGYQGQQLFTVYGHMSEINVSRGQHVELGQRIGLVGETGFVTGPHLHFEVRVGESDYFTTLNPELWLVPPQGWGVAVARIMDTAGQLYTREVLWITSKKTKQVWKAIPYAGGAVNSDPYYRENMVISDLPAGKYTVKTTYAGRPFDLEFEIFPGRVTYFIFRGRDGFSLELPPVPGEDFTP